MRVHLRLEMGALCLAAQLLWPKAGLAADTFNWRTNADLVSADIRDGKLSWLLEEITSATGWRIFVEPDVSHIVSTKFENLPPGEALRLLLGDLNYALIPEAGTSHKLFIFRTTMGNATQRVVVPDLARPRGPEGVLPGRSRRRETPDRGRTEVPPPG